MSAERLRLYVERIERLIEERSALSQEIRDVFSEAKGEGYDVATIRKLIARRGMEPHQRAEADALIETYEAAMGMVPGAPPPSITTVRPDAAAIALELLTAEIVAIEEPAHAAALVEHVIAILDLRAEIAVLRAQESGRKKLAKEEGFEVQQLHLVVRWFEKVAKFGIDAMKAGEATFGLYRGTIDQHHARAHASDRDRALMEMFAGGEDLLVKPAARKGVSSAAALARAAKEARRYG